MDPEGKSHPTDAYNQTATLSVLNRDYSRSIIHDGEENTRVSSNSIMNTTIYKSDYGYYALKNGNVVMVYHNDIAYIDDNIRKDDFPLRFQPSYLNSFNKGKLVEIDPKNIKKVKYPSEYMELLDSTVKINKESYPHLIQRKKINDEYFEIRSEKEYTKKNQGITIAIMNSEGMVVARASNEWGATLIVVAEEFSGKRLGVLLKKYWSKFNPDFLSGGFTPQGRLMAQKYWATAVAELLASGIYSEKVSQGKISKEKLKEILKDYENLRSKIKSPKKKIKIDPSPVIFSDEIQIIIYDAIVMTDDSIDPDDYESFVYGHAFLRNDNERRTIIYSIDYDKGYRDLTTYAILQLAKDNNDTIYLESSGDILELDKLKNSKKNLTVEEGFLSLKNDVINLNKHLMVHKRLVKKHDPYQEKFVIIQEEANSKKWR